MAKKNLRTQQYWKDRMDEIFEYVDRTDLDFFDELQTIYTDARRNIQKEIYAFYAQYAKDNQITPQEAKQRLMRDDLSDYRKNAEKYFKQAEKDPELLKRLNEQYKSGKVTRLEALQLDLQYQIGKMSGQLNKSFESYLKEIAKYAYRKIAFGKSASTLNTPALKKIVETPFNGKNYSSSIWGNADDLAADLKKVLSQGFIKGSGPADMARELRKKYNVAKSRAEAIVRTDGTNIINNATAQRYIEAGLTKYEFHAHIDERTTKICIEHNRKIYELVDFQPGLNAPPMHVNCRSTIVPVDDELNMNESAEDGIIDLEIDELTPCLKDTKTGNLVDTKHKPVKISPAMAKRLQKQGWNFDWSKEKGNLVQLTLVDSDDIQGLVAYHNDQGFTFVDLVESAPHNIGKDKQYSGVGGHLFAIAAEESFRAGNDGYISFTPKTALKEHYAKELGAKEISLGNMFLDTEASLVLIRKYMEK